MIVLVYLIVLLGGFPLFPRFFAWCKGKGVTHDCASILDSIARGISLVSTIFAWCSPSLHPHSFS